MIVNRLMILFVLFALLLAGCTSGAPRADLTNLPTPAPAATSRGPGHKPNLPDPPSPTATFATPGMPSTELDYASAVVVSSTTTATSPAPGWTRYESINDIRALAFAPDGTLWAAASDSLVHWSLSTSNYTRYQIKATDVAVAPDGTPWLALEHRVCRFDGIACEIYTEANGLLHNSVRTIAVAADGVVWVGTERGVSRFDGTSWRNYPSDVPTTDLAIGSNGEVWAATTGGVGRYLPALDAWETYTQEHGLPAFNVQNVATGPAGEVWAYLLWEGIYRFENESWHKVDGIDGLVSDVAFSANGTPWVVTVSQHYPAGSLSYHNGDTWLDITRVQGFNPSGPLALGPGGEVAAATTLGLGVYEDGQWRLLRDGPTSERVTTVAVTPDGAAWFGFGDHSISTPGWGVSRFDGDRWQYFLGDAEVNVLAVALDGTLWAGVGCSVQRFDGPTWRTVGSCQEDLPAGNIVDMAITPDGTIWVANGFALARFDGQAWEIYDKLANSVDAAQDGTVWINGWEGRQDSDFIARWDGAGWMTYKSADAYPGTFRVAAVTPDGQVWGFVPGRGLASFDGEAWEKSESWAFYPLPVGFSSDYQQIVDVTPDGALWVRGGNDLARFDPSAEPAEAWTLLAIDSSLADHHSRAAAIGPNGEIWLGATRFRQVEATPSIP